jgi:DNA-binding beta-propeller fold protein YncE
MVSGPGSFIVGTPNAESGASIKRGNNRADVRFNGSTLKLVAAPGSGPPPSTFGIAIDTGGNVGIGTEAPLARLDVRGTTRTCVLTITGGCDLAEPFPMNASDAPKGSVVVIDDENPGRLKLSDRAYDTRVAGIVSGANGINPGISLQQEGALEGGQNVALSGRVYVQADAAFGAIKPGDLLTTSCTPGHAMKVNDHAKAQGAILGKAMSPLKEGKGMVLVLVTLQ